MSAGKVLIGIVIAGAAGAVLGVLFAPAKGTDTRKRIVHQSEELTGQRESHLTRYTGAGSVGYETFTDSAMDWADMGSAPVYASAGIRRAR